MTKRTYTLLTLRVREVVVCSVSTIIILGENDYTIIIEELIITFTCSYLACVYIVLRESDSCFVIVKFLGQCGFQLFGTNRFSNSQYTTVMCVESQIYLEYL